MAMANRARVAGILSKFSRFQTHQTKSSRLLCTRGVSDKVKFERRVFSGIQPTGIPHLGNYFGAVKHWVDLQNRFDSLVYSIVDLHAITMKQEPQQLRQNILDMMACLLACGIDPKKSILFQQSTVSQHAELAWIFGCITTMPRLQHLPQWKQKSEAMKEVPLGLFTYPVLQSADILLYKATDVPVGDDQVKHVELARDLSKVFNKNYGTLFPKPKAITGEFVRLKSLRSPDNKMSKSEKDSRGRIELTDSPDEIREKLKKSKTDFTSSVTYDPVGRPGVSNLIDIHCAFTGLSPEEVFEQSLHLDTLSYKMVVADVVIENLKPIRDEILRLKGDPEFLRKALQQGTERAVEIAADTYKDVQSMVGFL